MPAHAQPGVGRPIAGAGAVPNAGQLRAQPFSGATLDGRLRERPASGPGAVPNPVQLPRQPFAGSPGAGFTGPARGRGDGYGATLVGDDGGFTAYGGEVEPEEYGLPDVPPPRVIPGVGPSPCQPPAQIIKVGRGLQNPARTRVVYGVRSPCGYR